MIFGILLLTFMLPFVATLIPTFLLWTGLRLTNTDWPLVLPHWFGSDVFFIFLLRQFFRTIPSEMDEAAILDGANPLQVLWHIILPLSRPALATVAILSGLSSWERLPRPSRLSERLGQIHSGAGLSEFTGLYSSQWNLLMAAATVIIVLSPRSSFLPSATSSRASASPGQKAETFDLQGSSPWLKPEKSASTPSR